MQRARWAINISRSADEFTSSSLGLSIFFVAVPACVRAQPVWETVLYKSRIFPRFLFSFLTTVGPTKVKRVGSECDFNCENLFKLCKRCKIKKRHSLQLKSSARKIQKHLKNWKITAKWIIVESIFSELIKNKQFFDHLENIKNISSRRGPLIIFCDV